MTIASEITRLQWAKASARTSIINKWVDVPASAKVDDYHTYIDQISTWVPLKDFQIAESASTWVTIWYPYVNFISNYRPFWLWNGLMCCIWNYIFMIWAFWFSWEISTTRRFWRHAGIYYKEIWSNTWNYCGNDDWNFDNNRAWDFSLTLSWVYISSDNSINIHVSYSWYYGIDVYDFYYDWTIGSNTLTQSTAKSWESLDNYKIYNSETNSWVILANEATAIWFKITSSLL